MKKIYGMKLKDWNILGKILNPPTTNCNVRFETVEEYIANHPESVTDRRLSKKGIELIQVTYPTGKVKEYPLMHLSTTTAFEY